MNPAAQPSLADLADLAPAAEVDGPQEEGVEVQAPGDVDADMAVIDAVAVDHVQAADDARPADVSWAAVNIQPAAAAWTADNAQETGRPEDDPMDDEADSGNLMEDADGSVEEEEIPDSMVVE